MEKHLVVERTIVKINNLTKKISLRILITRQPGGIEANLALGGNKEYIQSGVLSFLNHTTGRDDSNNIVTRDDLAC